MIKIISVESELIPRSEVKSIAELMDILTAPAKLAEIAEKSCPSQTDWSPRMLLEIDRSTPKSDVQ